MDTKYMKQGAISYEAKPRNHKDTLFSFNTKKAKIGVPGSNHPLCLETGGHI
jgi:hypothetical protein